MRFMCFTVLRVFRADDLSIFSMMCICTCSEHWWGTCHLHAFIPGSEVLGRQSQNFKKKYIYVSCESAALMRLQPSNKISGRSKMAKICEAFAATKTVF